MAVEQLLMQLRCAGQLIFVASYYDYVRLRNFLREQEVQVAALSEYAAPKEAARARSLFLDGRLHVALLTERSHFYNRARVRGVQVRFWVYPVQQGCTIIHHKSSFAEKALPRRACASEVTHSRPLAALGAHMAATICWVRCSCAPLFAYA